MIDPRLFVCSGARVLTTDAVAAGRRCVPLNSMGKHANVNIRFENVARVLRQQLSPRLMDFLEIAAYVYSADCATSRESAWDDEGGTEPWGRDFAFVVAVREPDFWGASKVKRLIENVLTFLSNDNYSFTFVPLEHQHKAQEQYFAFGDLRDWPFHGLERVYMFSGGLDSLAGTVETASAKGKSVLVSHGPVSTQIARQKKLFQQLNRLFPNQLFHIPVWINKNEKLGREATQRTRSFLFTALGTLVAESVQAKGVRFYENGIVSLNFPLADEVLRARASRTTHPLALHLLSRLCVEVTGREFTVDNPYLFRTKTEVVESLAANQATYLIAYTCSCSHSMFQCKEHPHCGRCSQCIDRRFAMTAAGLLAQDSESDYVSDVFTGARPDALEQAIAVDYTRHGIELDRRSESELMAQFNTEISRAVRYQPERSKAARNIIAMHKRHGSVVARVLEQKVRENAAGLLDRTIESTSLLALAVGQPSTDGRIPETNAAVMSGRNQSDSETLTSIREDLKAFFARFDSKEPSQVKKKKRRKPGHRLTVIFAAILKALKGMKYCSYLDDHRITPKWSQDEAPRTYQQGYSLGQPWRKKIQDEKTRAKVAMRNYEASMLSDAFVTYMSAEFNEISALLCSRNSQNASKNFAPLHTP